MNVVRLADVQATPWRNGGGVTRELLAWPRAADWQLRLSVAEVASDGPFSRFDGIERWFAVLAGEGVRLHVGGVVHEVRRGSPPLRFDGGAGVLAELIDGPTTDFNLMARPGVAALRWETGALVVDSRLLAARYDVASCTLHWEPKEPAR